MADTEEPQFTSLQERIAALNKQKNFTTPSTKRAPPPPPPNRPPSRAPSQLQTAASSAPNGHSPNLTPTIPTRPTKKPPPPVLPQRSNTAYETPARSNLAPPTPIRDLERTQTSPALPLRRPSVQSLAVRRNSGDSIRSTISSISLTGSTEARKLPPAFDQATLPTLPPSRREREAAQNQERADAKQATAAKIIRAPQLPSRSTSALPTGTVSGSCSSPSLPPRLPSRPARTPGIVETEEPAPVLPARRLPPPTDKFVRTIPQVSGNTASGTPADESVAAPPPVPISSRPSMAQIKAVASKGAARQEEASCLICRDFSGPDSVATQHPPSVIDRADPVGYLAHNLCGPFASPTDKARAIFTWCHHNINYDVAGFFAGCPRRGTASETIFSGLAVCEGYARTYEAIAKRAGLACVVIGGHGKGYGFEPVKDGQPLPRRNATGHAWNAVKIDNGYWKLIDPCWGAGHLSGNAYNREFNATQFTMSNEMFGRKHFPEDRKHFFRDDGRIPSWEEYVIGPTGGEPPQWFSNTVEEGLSEWNSEPAQKKIPVNSGESVRFLMGKICEHWTAEKNGRGKPRLLMLNIHGVDGNQHEQIPLDTDGYWWWGDIQARDLGIPGQKVQLYGLDVLNGQDAMGLSKQEFLRTLSSGNYSMSWVSIAEWELV